MTLGLKSVEICDLRKKREGRKHDSLRGSALWPTSMGQESKTLHFLIHLS